jgi:hypothetical protein
MATAPSPRPEPERRSGVFLIDNQHLQDFARLLSSDDQRFSMLFIHSELTTVGKQREWTRVITDEELARFSRCDIPHIKAAMEDLVARRVIEREQKANGYVYHIPFETWGEL